MKQLFLLITISLFSYSMQEPVNYMHLLPNEVAELIITQIPDPTSTLAKAAQSIVPLTLVSQPLSVTPQFLMQDYKNRDNNVKKFLQEHSNVFEHVLFALPRARHLCRDVRAIKTISHALHSEPTTVPMIMNDFKRYKTFEIDDLKECLRNNIEETNLLLKERYDCLESDYRKANSHYRLSNQNRIMDELKPTIDDMILLLQSGANAKATRIFVGVTIPLLHEVTIVGNCELVKAFLDHGADIHSLTDLDESVIEYLIFAVCHDNKNRIEILDVLLSRGISLSTLYNDNRTILDLAYRRHEDNELVKYLRIKGAKTYQELKDENLL